MQRSIVYSMTQNIELLNGKNNTLQTSHEMETENEPK